jgi:hypothetical protein
MMQVLTTQYYNIKRQSAQAKQLPNIDSSTIMQDLTAQQKQENK